MSEPIDAIRVNPEPGNLYIVSELAERILESAGCPMKIMTRLNIIIVKNSIDEVRMTMPTEKIY